MVTSTSTVPLGALALLLVSTGCSKLLGIDGEYGERNPKSSSGSAAGTATSSGGGGASSTASGSTSETTTTGGQGGSGGSTTSGTGGAGAAGGAGGTDCVGAPDGTPCDDQDECTHTDTCASGVCAGVATECPAPDECRAQGACEPATGQCMYPNKQDNTPCDDGNACTQNDACQSGSCLGAAVPSDTECRPSAGGCDPAETCDGTTAACPPDKIASMGAVCRIAAGLCDVPEICDGVSVACPEDGFDLSNKICRPAVPGGCDIAETCTGSSAGCPADVVQPANTSCRASAGLCDVPESCDGVSASCPADVFELSSKICRPAVPGGCDIAETCTGSSASCPSDVVQPANTSCRAAAGPCDLPESCNGSSASCPADGFELSSKVCRPAIPGGCDIAETCTGSSAACPADVVQPANTVCRAATGPCDVTETCTGAAACPPDGVQPAGTPCSDGNACTLNDTCQSGVCVGGNPVSCPAPAACHLPGTCSPATGICSNPIAANGSFCNDGNACTQTDTCQSGTCTGSNPVVCPPPDQCHAAGNCIVATGTCTNPIKVNGTPCNDGNSCTVADACVGGTCSGNTPAETCDGQDNDCNGIPDDNCTCLPPILAGDYNVCIEPSGRMLFNLQGIGFPNGSAQTYAEIQNGDWVVPLIFDFGAPAGQSGNCISYGAGNCVDLTLQPLQPGVAYVFVPNNLPGGLCPQHSGLQKHPFRLSNPYNYAVYAQIGLANQQQPGLVDHLPQQNGTYPPFDTIAVYKSPVDQLWRPAAALAHTLMTPPNVQAECYP